MDFKLTIYNHKKFDTLLEAANTQEKCKLMLEFLSFWDECKGSPIFHEYANFLFQHGAINYDECKYYKTLRWQVPGEKEYEECLRQYKEDADCAPTVIDFFDGKGHERKPKQRRWVHVGNGAYALRNIS
jgi:hypothetical protein